LRPPLVADRAEIDTPVPAAMTESKQAEDRKRDAGHPGEEKQN
jgi:hypothetical protein